MSKCYDEEGEQTSSTPVAKSKGYAPSELYISGSVSHFSPATDIYSLGATFYYLVTGLVPPDASLVSDEGINLSKFAGLSKPTRNAIEAAMQPRRKDRPQSIAEFLKILDGNYNAEDDDDVTDFDEHNSVRDGDTQKKIPNPAPKTSWLKWTVSAVAGLLIVFGLISFLHKADSECYQATGSINGHEYVDLGLSVKWATCNVGASSPSDYGDYYAWGETNTKAN